MTYYLGRAGNLVALPDPEVGLSQTPERIGGMHQLLSGNRVRDTLGRMRTWNLSWTAIDLTTFGTLAMFHTGSAGAGPYFFLDPEQRNLLTPNVAASTSVTNDTTGFTAGTNVTLTVNTQSLQVTPPNRLLLSETTAVTASQVVADTTTYVAVRPSTSYTFSTYGSIPAASPTHLFSLVWFDTAFAQISSTDLGSFANTTGFLAVTGTSPATAAYCRFQIKISTANTSGSTATATFEQIQLEQAAARSAWVPGVGVPVVTVDSLTRSTPLAGLCDAQMTLIQVG